MAYQQVGVPRFMVNILDWLDATGKGFTHVLANSDPDIHMTLPVVPRPIHWNSFNIQGAVGMNENSFIAILGHNLNSTEGVSWGVGSGVQIEMDNSTFYDNSDIITDDIVINQCHYRIDSRADYDGFSIMSFDGRDKTSFSVEGITIVESTNISTTFNAGSIIIGTFYDMKNAPNLSLTMSRDYGSTKDITTYNGSNISNTMVSKAPMWGPLGAWEMANFGHNTDQQALARSGRRTWKLKFSFMDDGDLFGPNQYLTTLRPENPSWIDIDAGISGYDSGDLQGAADPNPNQYVYNLLDDDNFFSQVWHKTAGGTLPFIFQPDKNNNNEWAIARFKNGTLKTTQTSPGFYDIAVSIEEAW